MAQRYTARPCRSMSGPHPPPKSRSCLPMSPCSAANRYGERRCALPAHVLQTHPMLAPGCTGQGREPERTRRGGRAQAAASRLQSARGRPGGTHWSMSPLQFFSVRWSARQPRRARRTGYVATGWQRCPWCRRVSCRTRRSARTSCRRRCWRRRRRALRGALPSLPANRSRCRRRVRRRSSCQRRRAPCPAPATCEWDIPELPRDARASAQPVLSDCFAAALTPRRSSDKLLRVW
jgi:hypothetical protein